MNFALPPDAERIALGPLSREATATLAAAILGAPLDGAAALAVWDTTRGNPLFVRELLLGNRDLVFERDLWRFTRRVTASARLVELLDARLATLAPSERDALELLVLAGELGRAHLAALADAPSVDALLARGLVTESIDRNRRTLRVAHPLYAEVVRESMGIVRRVSAARRLADGIEAFGARRRGDVLAVGTLRPRGRRRNRPGPHARGRPPRPRRVRRAAHRPARRGRPRRRRRRDRVDPRSGGARPHRRAPAGGPAARRRVRRRNHRSRPDVRGQQPGQDPLLGAGSGPRAVGDPRRCPRPDRRPGVAGRARRRAGDVRGLRRTSGGRAGAVRAVAVRADPARAAWPARSPPRRRSR